MLKNDSQIQEKQATLKKKIGDYIYIEWVIKIETDSKREYKIKTVFALETETIVNLAEHDYFRSRPSSKSNY